MPQSTHETMAIPFMKSALVIGIACLQLGHLYCLSGIIWATRHYHASGHYPEFHWILSPDHFHVQAWFPFWLYCILFRGQSKSLLVGCTVILAPHHPGFNRYLNRANEQNLINSFGFQEDNGNKYLEKVSKKSFDLIQALSGILEIFTHKFTLSGNCCCNNSDSG